MTTKETSLGPRVSKLEGQMAEMVLSVSRLANTIEKQEILQEKRDSAVHGKLDNVSNLINETKLATVQELANRTRTNWSVLIPAAALIVTVVTYIFSLNLAPIKESQHNLENRMNQESHLVHREMDLLNQINELRYNDLKERITPLLSAPR